jgi:hypothetical protein
MASCTPSSFSALRPRERVLEPIQEQGAIRQLGQRIVKRQVS